MSLLCLESHADIKLCIDRLVEAMLIIVGFAQCSPDEALGWVCVVVYLIYPEVAPL